MRSLKRPYATRVGPIHGGQWSSSVMDRLEIEAGVGAVLDETSREAKARIERTLANGLVSDA